MNTTIKEFWVKQGRNIEANTLSTEFFYKDFSGGIITYVAARFDAHKDYLKITGKEIEKNLVSMDCVI